MPEITALNTSAPQHKLDRQILLSLALSPLAAGMNTIVGYTVAHWITFVGNKNTGYLVSAACVALCALAAWLAWDAGRALASPDETLPEEGRQLFMAKLALLLSALCLLVVLAGTLVLITLEPGD
jgi:heme A synthase